MSIDERAHTIDISEEDPQGVAGFSYFTDTADILTIQGKEGGHLTSVKLRRIESNSLLNNNRVQWIHPFPPVNR